MSTHETVCNHLPILRHLASPSLQGPISHIWQSLLILNQWWPRSSSHLYTQVLHRYYYIHGELRNSSETILFSTQPKFLETHPTYHAFNSPDFLLLSNIWSCEHRVSFQLGTFTNKTAMNLHVQVVWKWGFISLGWKPECMTSGPFFF